MYIHVVLLKQCGDSPAIRSAPLQVFLQWLCRSSHRATSQQTQRYAKVEMFERNLEAGVVRERLHQVLQNFLSLTRCMLHMSTISDFLTCNLFDVRNE